MLNATLLGYIAGIAWGDAGLKRNPHAYVQAEAWAWQHGWEQGVERRIECDVCDPLPPEPLRCVMICEDNESAAVREKMAWLADRDRLVNLSAGLRYW